MHHLTLGPHDLGLAQRTALWHPPRFRPGLVLTRRADDLRDHVAGPLHDDEVSLADVLAADVVLVVQRRARHGHTADVNRLELCKRIENAGAAHADVDLREPRYCRRRRPLEGARETRASVERPEALLLVEGVDLDDDPVDLVAERGPTLLPGNAGVGHLGDRPDALRVRVRPEAALAEPIERLPLRREHRAIEHADPVDEDRERSLGGHRGVQLPKGTGRRIPCVRSRLLLRRELASLKRAKPSSGKRSRRDLDSRRRRAAEHAQRDRLDRAEIDGDVLSALPVTARRTAHEDAVLVDERHRRAVDLRLEDVGDGLVGVETLTHIVGPLLQRLPGRDLLEGAHRREVRHLREAGRGRCADALRGRIGSDEVGMLVFERPQLVEQHVVGAVVDLGIVEDVVAVIVVLDEPAKLRDAVGRRRSPR